MNLILRQVLDLADAHARRYLLTWSDGKVAQLTRDWGAHHKSIGTIVGTTQFLVLRLTVGNKHLTAQTCGDGVVAQALHLQLSLLLLILVLLFFHLQFGLALDAHTILLAALLERLVEARHLVGGIESLLAQRYALLLHLYLLFAIVALAVLP